MIGRRKSFEEEIYAFCLLSLISNLFLILGMLVELKLLKRQDLVGVIANAIKPAYDQLHIRYV